MAKKQTKATQIGDLFQIAIDDKLVAYGHVVAKCEPVYYMIAYDLLLFADQSPQIHNILRAPILFLGNFFDVLISTGRWKVVGKESPDLSRIPFPSYKVKIGDYFYVESWNGNRRRLVTAEEESLLDFRDNWGPMYLESALKAYYGHESWLDEFDKLTLPYVELRSRIQFDVPTIGRVVPP